MKPYVAFLVVAFSISFFFKASCQENYFYLKGGEKISFTRIDSLAIVKFNDSISMNEINRFITNKSQRLPLLLDKIKHTISRVNILRIKNQYSFDSLKLASELEYADYALKYSDGVIQGLSNQVIVKLKAGLTKKNLVDIIKTY
jgi:hypothetical protein